jgi:hypothetical protein
MLRYFLAWFPMLLIAFANGWLREALLRPRLGEDLARPLSTVLLLLFFLCYIALFTRRFRVPAAGTALKGGALWMLLTLAFEFGIGWYSGLSWETMLGEYRLDEGRLWVLVPLTVGLAPYAFYRLWQKETASIYTGDSSRRMHA